jgi:hypothetical protein
MLRRSACFWVIALPVILLAKREWREGQLLAVDIKDFQSGKHRVDHRYLCTIADGDLHYVVEYEKPLKVAVHDRVRFVVDKDKLIIEDADHKERPAKIEKRERAVPQ